MIYKILYRITDKALVYLSDLHNRVRKSKRAVVLGNVLYSNKELENKHTGKRCYLLGNAPSIDKHDLDKLKDDYVFAVNDFFLHDNFKNIRSDFYVFADPVYYEIQDGRIIEWWKDFIEKTHGRGLSYFMPFELKDTVVHELFKDEKVYFLDLSLPFYYHCVERFDIAQPINGAQNVLILCLQLAIYMGFTEIYLLGADHDWLSYHGQTKHFYSKGKPKVDLQEILGSLEYPYYWWLEAVSEMFRQYRAIDSYAKERHVRIYNASESGVLDVFPMVSFQESINNKK